METPGSPFALSEFHAVCRALVHVAISRHEQAQLLFTVDEEGSQLDARTWERSAWTEQTTSDLLNATVLDAIHKCSGSQIGVALPVLGQEPAILLLSVDEAELIVERAVFMLADDLVALGPWLAETIEGLHVTSWQRLLAHNAGYRCLTKWRCRRCGSVCPGEADAVPSPCDYCGGREIEAVPLEAPLREPAWPWSAVSGRA